MVHELEIACIRDHLRTQPALRVRSINGDTAQYTTEGTKQRLNLLFEACMCVLIIVFAGLVSPMRSGKCLHQPLACEFVALFFYQTGFCSKRFFVDAVMYCMLSNFVANIPRVRVPFESCHTHFMLHLS